jgi:hypothetical protein
MSARKIALASSETPPLCPWCQATLSRVYWHKVRGGPAVPYVILLSCGSCRAVLDWLSASSHHQSA